MRGGGSSSRLGSGGGAQPQASRGPGGRARRALIDRARGQVTPGATFPEPSRRWPPGPGRGRGRAGRREGLISQNKVAGLVAAGRGRRRGAGALEQRGPANRTCSASSSGERAPGCPAASPVPGGRHGGIQRPTLPPQPPALRSNKGARPRRGAEEGPGQRAARSELWSRPAPGRRAGGRCQSRASSRRGARRSLGLPSRRGNHRERRPLLLGRFCRRETL